MILHFVSLFCLKGILNEFCVLGNLQSGHIHSYIIKPNSYVPKYFLLSTPLQISLESERVFQLSSTGFGLGYGFMALDEILASLK